MSVAASKTATSLRKAAGPRSAVNHLSKSVVRDTEGAAKQKPHATFCGNRGRATAPGDPVAGVQFPCATRLMPPAVATAIPGRFGKVRSRSRIGRYEESDGRIVPMKPRTTPAGGLVAESVEGRV